MLENVTETEYTVHDFIRGRWSPLAFSKRPVEREKLFVLLEAARSLSLQLRTIRPSTIACSVACMITINAGRNLLLY